MTHTTMHTTLNYCIALVWVVNGLLCKVLNLVPRHEQIVARILGNDYSRLLTITIGLLEVVMAIWIVSGFKARIQTVVQIGIIATMNILEFILVPDLLLWGRMNLVVACLLILVIWYNEYILNKNTIR
ncbi:MAG: DoxX-like family protein [Bacteroidota bacterium]